METETEVKPPNIWNAIAARALRTGAHIPIAEEEFDRERALCGLHWNFGHNRRPKQYVVTKFAQIIKDGSFAIGSTLRIARDENGEWILVDGQHRLAAIAESGARVWLMVAIDERPARIAYASIDNVGTLRGARDAVSSLLGWSTKNWNAVCGAAAIISHDFSRRSILGSTPNGASVAKKHSFIAETVAKYKETILQFSDLRLPNAQFRRAPALAVHIVTAHHAPDVFWPYFNAAIKDDMLAKHSPEKKLTETLVMPAKYSNERLKLFVFTVACWNAAYTKTEIQKFPKFNEDEQTPVPSILGTPYAK